MQNSNKDAGFEEMVNAKSKMLLSDAIWYVCPDTRQNKVNCKFQSHSSILFIFKVIRL